MIFKKFRLVRFIWVVLIPGGCIFPGRLDYFRRIRNIKWWVVEEGGENVDVL